MGIPVHTKGYCCQYPSDDENFFFNPILMVVIKPPIIQRPAGTRTAQDVGMLPTCCMSCVVLCEFIELCELLPVPSVCLMVLIFSSTLFKSCTLLLLYLVLTDLMASPSATTFPTRPDAACHMHFWWHICTLAVWAFWPPSFQAPVLLPATLFNS